MELSHTTIAAICERFDWQTANDIGNEPDFTGQQTLVVLGDYWLEPGRDGWHEKLRDDKHASQLAGWDKRWPRIWRQLEEQGVNFVWYDEYTIDYSRNRAWRTSASSYHWEPAVAYLDGDIITPDDDWDTWLDWAKDSTDRCLTTEMVPELFSLLRASGFEQYGERYESGWHPGQDDTPEKVRDAMIREHGPLIDFVFTIAENSQFYTKWCAWWRPVPKEDAA